MNGEKMLEVVKVMTDLNRDFFLKKVYLNSDHMISIEEDIAVTELFQTNPEKFPEGLDERQTFSSISFSGWFTPATQRDQCVTVVGSPETLLSKT
tara:strand:- start:1237 stop:1521 length:285 start_codon:yes stop_codon:yes gene_type:complete